MDFDQNCSNDSFRYPYTMRLLNTKTLKLEEFYELNMPEYAILSHTWDGAETTLQDWEAGIKTDSPGHVKVLTFSYYAAAEGYDWCWADTMCIDKKSSADLSEAINSMFDWYCEAGLCIIYLSDVKISGSREKTLRDFEGSRWFTRGWTLQELIGSSAATFRDLDWEPIGGKSGLLASIIAATGIPSTYITCPSSIEQASIAQKMSWASRRKTSRIEDMAYCLMGLFGINMPLLYGERNKAFRRLQEEIMKVSDDESIFVWSRTYSYDESMFSLPRSIYDESYLSGCLAPDSASFHGCGDVVCAQSDAGRNLGGWEGKPAYSLVKKNMELYAFITESSQASHTTTRSLAFRDGDTITIALNCYPEDSPEDRYFRLCLKHDGYAWWRYSDFRDWRYSDFRDNPTISLSTEVRRAIVRTPLQLKAYGD